MVIGKCYSFLGIFETDYNMTIRAVVLLLLLVCSQCVTTPTPTTPTATPAKCTCCKTDSSMFQCVAPYDHCATNPNGRYINIHADGMCFGYEQYSKSGTKHALDCLPPKDTLEWCQNNLNNASNYPSPQCIMACYHRFRHNLSLVFNYATTTQKTRWDIESSTRADSENTTDGECSDQKRVIFFLSVSIAILCIMLLLSIVINVGLLFGQKIKSWIQACPTPCTKSTEEEKTKKEGVKKRNANGKEYNAASTKEDDGDMKKDDEAVSKNRDGETGRKSAGADPDDIGMRNKNPPPPIDEIVDEPLLNMSSEYSDGSIQQQTCDTGV